MILAPCLLSRKIKHAYGLRPLTMTNTPYRENEAYIINRTTCISYGNTLSVHDL